MQLPPVERRSWNESPLPSTSGYNHIQKHIKIPQPMLKHALSPHVKSYSPNAPQKPEHSAAKRSFGQVFNDSPLDAPSKNGARPNELYGEDALDAEDDFLPPPTMYYKRADGEKVRKNFVIQ
jgi:hypothetical protein